MDSVLATFWAKSSPDPSDSLQMHPLLCHMVDVGCVAHSMWEDVLGPWKRRQIAEGIGYTESQEDLAGKWVAFWAGLHDLGKASPGFQLCHAPSADALRNTFSQAGLPCSNTRVRQAFRDRLAQMGKMVRDLMRTT